MAPIFDTHVHYDDDAFAKDRSEVLASLKEYKETEPSFQEIPGVHLVGY